MKGILFDFLIFTYKQAYACIFGFFLVFIIILTKYYYPLDGIIYRYDFLFLSAIIFQVVLIVTKLESWREVGVIAIFHIVATVMEVFKTSPSIASWSYPEGFVIGIMGVPLFAGFMYSAVGSYIARVWRIFDFRYTDYPSKAATIGLGLAVYINFFSHHFIPDLRYIILIITLYLFRHTQIHFRPDTRYYSMSLVVGFGLVAFVIWIAENIATSMHIWIYPSQTHIWHMVSPEKILAWFLLMIISFVLVSLVHKPQPYRQH